MIHVVVTSMPHLLSDERAAKLGPFLQAIVATAFDVPHDASAAVRKNDVSVVLQEYGRGTNIPAVEILVRVPDHPLRRKNLASRLNTIAEALRAYPDMPSSTVTGEGQVSVGVEFVQGAAIRF